MIRLSTTNLTSHRFNKGPRDKEKCEAIKFRAFSYVNTLDDIAIEGKIARILNN